ncbi:MAG: DUF3617 domain-containing protein [Cellvibrionaceae bacterium]
MEITHFISRNIKYIIAISFFVAGFQASSVVADNNIASGLWKHSFKVKSESGEIEKALAQAQQAIAAMPAEQRAMIEKMMKAQGVDFNLKSYTAKVCVTPEQAKETVLPKPTDNCSQVISDKTDKGYKIRYECSGNPPTSGEGEIIFADDKNYSIIVTMNMQINNSPEKMTVFQTGKWMAKSCE